MINGTLMLRLLKAVPSGCKVIFMGDVQQLPPIGDCQVFEDILNSSYIPTIKLLHPHRQALQSGIIKSSYLVANQEKLFDNTADYRIDFSDWTNHTNGNVHCIIFLSLIFISLIFLIIGYIKTKRKS